VRGIDLLQHDIERARAAVPRGDWIQGDIRTTPFGAAGTVIILDVLHYIGRAEQDAVLERVRGALPAGGRALVRVADASRTLRLRITVALDQLMCVVRRQPLARLHTRPLTEWMATMDRLGLRARPVPMSQGTPFANVLLVADAA
jgi:S-adenosylmethionine:diacylglycerol 3-amino-3-carboxypropyl transferase